MEVNLSFKGMGASDSVRFYTLRKSEKIKKYFSGKIHLHWNFSAEKLDLVAHCHLVGRDMDYFAEDSDEDIHIAIDRVVDKLEKQVRRQKEIKKNHLHHAV